MANRELHTRFTLSIACFLLVSGLFAQTPPIRIMPLGDSITYGSSAPANVPGGYRLPLYVALTNAGYNIDYVGTQNGNGATGLPDPDHEGHGGWNIDGINGNVLDWFNATADPDVILLHIGTNDSGAGDFSNRVDRLDSLVTKMATNRPNAHIIVTTLMVRNEPYYTAITNLFNPYVEAKVVGQQNLGRKVHFLDMHAYLQLSDLADVVHPNAGGYQKMANAWFPVITNVIGVTGDTNAPAVARAVNLTSLQGVAVTFSKAVDPATATNTANYALSGGVSISGATLSADRRTVTLATSTLTRDALYSVAVNNVTDLSAPTPLVIAPDSSDSFRATLRGYLNNVPESSGYKLACTLNLPNSAAYRDNLVPYSVDNRSQLNGPLERVAYYLELQTLNGDLTYLWVSMDAYTNDIALIGVPALITGAVHQKYVSNMNIVCNDPNVTTGTVATANIEFWPYNYSAVNAKGIPEASDATYDFGDRCDFNWTYACMQVHNYTAKQTLFAFNNWGGSGSTPDLGIGNKPTGNPDWTFSNNAGDYPIRTLHVFVTLGTETTPPTLVSAQAGSAGTLVTVTFSEALAADSVDGTRFTLDNGVSVISATLLPDLRTVTLLTTVQPPDTSLTLTVTGVRDLSGGTLITPGSSIAVAASELPPEVTANAGALADGYQLVYTLDIPITGKFNSSSDPYRYNQSLATGSFDRVAYYLELVNANTTTQYLWASMDTFTPYRKQIGVPTSASKAVFQQLVYNLTVKSNVGGISNGTFVTGGNLEFWPTDYGGANALGITNATGSFDFGDTRSTGGGHGSMQVHNYSAMQTLFAMNNWGTDNQTLALGIGNRNTGEKDWTFAANAGSYFKRTLHVLVRPCAPAVADLPPEVLANIPNLAGYQLACSITNIPVQTRFQDATNYYTFDRRALIGAGSFSRVAYYLELQSTGGPGPQYVWTAMDTFTTDPAKIAVPVGGVLFQQKVNRLDVFSNVGGIINGNGLTTGNIEFWPSGYVQANSANIPNASPSYYDFGDGGAGSGGGGYGSMQVHNHGASQTLFAMNNFNTTNSGNAVCLGIGNRAGNNDTDWTHAHNAASYDLRRVLHVFVLPGGDPDTLQPTLGTASASRTLDKVILTFSETLADSAVQEGSFMITGGDITVLAKLLMPNKRDIMLTTSHLTSGQNYQVTVSGVRDRSSNGNLIAANSTAGFTAPPSSLPGVLSNVPESSEYSLIYQLAVANSTGYANGAPYAVDESPYPQPGPFDRIAYCMELLGTNGVYKWVYASMDAFSSDITKVGVPTADRGAAFQKYVNNMNVYASENVANITVTTGVGIATGNIEFWPSNYGDDNTANITNASSDTYDWGDSGFSTGTGHGSMQIHNWGGRHTILSFVMFGAGARTPGLGIGNNPGIGISDPDWTFTANGTSFNTKNIYVLVRRSDTLPPPGNGPDIYTQPHARTVHVRDTADFYVQANGATSYQWRHNGAWVPGANRSFLEIDSSRREDEGQYDVLIFGASGYTVSQSATLTVLQDGSLLWLK